MFLTHLTNLRGINCSQMSFSTSIAITPLLAQSSGFFPDPWIVVTAAATNVACAIIGCFLVLRRLSLMGDALSHAVLPGLVLAFLFSHSLSIVPLFLGAAAVGLLTTFLIQTLHQYGRVPSDASMGVVFTSLFALGIILIKTSKVGHFDVSCVYEGSLEYVVLSNRILGLPQPLFTTLAVLVINLFCLALLWKEFKISSFDAALASTMGLSSTLLHYLLMTLVAVTTVASFEAVGSILVVAMLIVPAATAHLLTDRLHWMVFISAGVGILAALFGSAAAVYFNTNIAGMVTVVAGLIYGLAVFFSPKYGICSTLYHNLQMSLRVLQEDLLAMLYRLEELGNPDQLTASEAREAVGGGFLSRLGLMTLLRSEKVHVVNEELQLTELGRNDAKALVRSHRLWETYLVQFLGMPLDHVHEPAHRVEHFIDEQLRQDLEAEVESASQDPHGREIPE